MQQHNSTVVKYTGHASCGVCETGHWATKTSRFFSDRLETEEKLLIEFILTSHLIQIFNVSKSNLQKWNFIQKKKTPTHNVTQIGEHRLGLSVFYIFRTKKKHYSEPNVNFNIWGRTKIIPLNIYKHWALFYTQ